MTGKFDFKDKYNCDDLINIVSLLRAPGGCPWDAEQTHESIKKGFIEETYEVIEAINKKNPDMLREELGDVLLQVVFHALIEEEKGVFNFNDVCDGICKKLILRHPHVFGSVKVSSTDEVLTNWDVIKMETKRQNTVSEVMRSIPKELPALMRGQKIQKKAAKNGFDWDSFSGALDKVEEETKEVREAFSSGNKKQLEEEIGDLLFSVVNVSRFAQIDSEEALTEANDKFIARFTKLEQAAKDEGVDIKTSKMEILDKLWNKIKAQEK